jgi:hypothetical protein
MDDLSNGKPVSSTYLGLWCDTGGNTRASKFWPVGCARAEGMADSDASLAATLPYSPAAQVRPLQIDLVVYNEAEERLGAYESKRGAGYHDSGKIRSMRRDLRCTQMLLRGYGEARGLRVREANARMIFYYGQCSVGPPWALTGKDLDAHFGFPVWESVEHVNGYFRERLDALLASV